MDAGSYILSALQETPLANTDNRGANSSTTARTAPGSTPGFSLANAGATAGHLLTAGAGMVAHAAVDGFQGLRQDLTQSDALKGMNASSAALQAQSAKAFHDYRSGAITKDQYIQQTKGVTDQQLALSKQAHDEAGKFGTYQAVAGHYAQAAGTVATVAAPFLAPEIVGADALAQASNLNKVRQGIQDAVGANKVGSKALNIVGDTIGAGKSLSGVSNPVGKAILATPGKLVRNAAFTQPTGQFAGDTGAAVAHGDWKTAGTNAALVAGGEGVVRGLPMLGKVISSAFHDSSGMLDHIILKGGPTGTWTGTQALDAAKAKADASGNYKGYNSIVNALKVSQDQNLAEHGTSKAAAQSITDWHNAHNNPTENLSLNQFANAQRGLASDARAAAADHGAGNLHQVDANGNFVPVDSSLSGHITAANTNSTERGGIAKLFRELGQVAGYGAAKDKYPEFFANPNNDKAVQSIVSRSKTGNDAANMMSKEFIGGKAVYVKREVVPATESAAATKTQDVITKNLSTPSNSAPYNENNPLMNGTVGSKSVKGDPITDALSTPAGSTAKEAIPAPTSDLPSAGTSHPDSPAVHTEVGPDGKTYEYVPARYSNDHFATVTQHPTAPFRTADVVGDLVRGHTAPMGGVGRALDKIGLSPAAQPPRETFAAIKQDFIDSSSQLNGIDAKKAENFYNNLRKANGLTKAVYDPRMTGKTTFAQVGSESGIGSEHYAALRQNLNDAYTNRTFAQRGMGNKLVDQAYSHLPGFGTYMKMQSYGRFGINPFFGGKVITKSFLAAQAQAGGSVGVGRVSREVDQYIKSRGDFGGIVNEYTGAEGVNVKPGWVGAVQQNLAGNMVQQVLRNNHTTVQGLADNPALKHEIEHSLDALYGYPKGGFLDSNLARTLNIAIFPFRFEAKIASIGAKALMRMNPVTRGAVVGGLVQANTWAKSPEGQKWAKDNADFNQLVGYFTPTQTLTKVLATLANPSQAKIGDLGEIGGLPFGVITTILSHQFPGFDNAVNSKAVNPRTGEEYTKTIPVSLAARGQQMTTDLISSMFSFPGRTLGFDSKTSFVQKLPGLNPKNLGPDAYQKVTGAPAAPTAPVSSINVPTDFHTAPTATMAQKLPRSAYPAKAPRAKKIAQPIP